MKIALSTSYVGHRGGGVAEVVLQLSKALSARGVETSIHSRRGPEPLTSANAEFNSVTESGGVISTYRSLSHVSMDILHSHGLWSPVLSAAILSAFSKGTPVVISPHGMLDDWALDQGRAKKRVALATYEGINLRKAACIHALTLAEAESIRSIAPRRPLAVIPNGVVLPDLNLVTENENKTLLFLGRINKKKGIIELISGFAKASTLPVARGWQLKIAGWDDGGHLAEVLRHIDRLGLRDRVTCVGPIFGTDKVNALANCSAMVLASFSEGLPMAVLEAWSYGKPVIMTHHCNLPEGEEAGAAIICDPSAEAIAKTLEIFVSMSPDAQLAMGKAGRDLVERRFSFTRVARDFEQLYNWILAAGGKPSFVK